MMCSVWFRVKNTGLGVEVGGGVFRANGLHPEVTLCRLRGC